jgi:hypothetical protein
MEKPARPQAVDAIAAAAAAAAYGSIARRHY